jgi:hypothetical protein
MARAVRSRPRFAAAGSNAPGSGGGDSRLNWEARRASSFDDTRSGGLLTSTPMRGSANRPWPCIWVMATYAFQYEITPSPVKISRLTCRRPNAGGRTTGMFSPSMLKRGSYRPGPHDV